MKSKRALLNVILNTIAQVIYIALAFVVRRIFISTLGSNVLGLNSLFSSILTFLSIGEFGISISIAVCLYKPLVDDDKDKIIAYMRLLKKIYSYIGFGIVGVGLILAPFLHIMVKGNFENSFIINAFIIYLLSVAVTYFYSYKKVMLEADQKTYLISAVQILYKIVLNLGQIVILLLTKNYYLFLAFNILCNFTENFITAHICDREYPFLNGSNMKSKNTVLSAADRKKVFQNVKGLLCYKISNYLIEGTDNIIISSILGTIYVAYYANYYLVINMLIAIFACVGSSAIAGLGNILYSDKENLKGAFSKLLLLQHFIYSFSVTAFLLLITDFVNVFFGGESVMPFSVVILMASIYYIKGYSQGIEAIRNSAGLYDKDKYINLGIACLNIVLSTMLISQIGIAGVLIGTLVCYILKEFIVVPHIVFKEIFTGQHRWYISVYTKHGIITCIIIGISFFIHKQLTFGNIFVSWIANGILCLFVSVFVNIVIFHNTWEFQQLKATLINIIKRKV